MILRLAAVVLAVVCTAGAQDPGVRTIEIDGGKKIAVDERDAVFEIRVKELEGGESGPDITPSFAGIRPGGISVAMLEAVSKRFNDRLVATLDLHVDREWRIPLVRQLYEKARTRSGVHWVQAAAQLAAALQLAGAFPAEQKLPPGTIAAVAAFLGDRMRSKPIGFYTWSEELERSFRLERFLQPARELSGKGAWLGHVTKDVAADEALRTQYESLLRFSAVITNPAVVPGLLDASRPEVSVVAFFPASGTPEGTLIKHLYADRPIPPGVDLIDEFVNAVRGRKVELTPTPHSGFYDWQVFALEPLVNAEVCAEAKKVVRDASYQEVCDAAFKAALTQRRETHVKRLEPLLMGSMKPAKTPVKIAPALTIEPQVTYLRRTADGYAHLKEALTGLFGEKLLRELPLRNEDQSAGPPVFDELTAIERRIRAFAALSCRELGADVAFAGAGTEVKLADEATRYLQSENWKQDLAYDPRVIVPVAFNVETGKLRCWAVVGVTRRVAYVSYKTAPRIAAEGHYLVVEPEYMLLPVQVVVECELGEPPTRAEFRKLCDAHATVAAIKEALATL